MIIGALAMTSARAAQWRVTASQPEADLYRIAEEAAAGDSIVVGPGVYTCTNLTIRKPLSIQGEPGAILDGAGEGDILVVASSDVRVGGLTFRNTGTSYLRDRAAVRVEGATGCVVESNRIENASFAVYLAHTSNSVVRGNVVTGDRRSQSATGNGVHLWYCSRVLVEDNTVSGQRDGIYFEFVTDGDIRGNRAEENLRYGLHFMFSDRCRYEGNTFRGNGAGVAVMYTRNVEMVGNRFEHNRGSAAYGLLLKDITDSRVQDNLFVRNSIGVYGENSSRIAFERNLFEQNGWAARILANCQDCVFRGNDFVGNSFEVITNNRRNPNRFEGNYWSQYRGYDLDRDGTGDVPHHPVRLFAVLVEQNPPALLLLRSLFAQCLDLAEMVMPSLTPETLTDAKPAMRRFR